MYVCIAYCSCIFIIVSNVCGQEAVGVGVMLNYDKTSF